MPAYLDGPVFDFGLTSVEFTNGPTPVYADDGRTQLGFASVTLEQYVREGHRLAGYRKGERCGAVATLSHPDGGVYCPNHTPEAVKAHLKRQAEKRARRKLKP